MIAAPLNVEDVDQVLALHDSAGLMLLEQSGRFVGRPAGNPAMVREILRLARLGALAEAGGLAMTSAVVDLARREWERLSPP